MYVRVSTLAFIFGAAFLIGGFKILGGIALGAGLVWYLLTSKLGA